MRAGVTFVVCGALALSVAGCDPLIERRYINEGAGVDLYTSDRASQIELLNQYENFICAQVGRSCDNATFVQAGMNDIDLRCDGFLTWLDARRRDKEPVLAELTAIGAAVHTVMTVTGSSPKALDIVTAAFGLASASYINWNSRLLISVNQSTVQEVVYKSQWQFREKIKTFPIPDRPTAIYLLRNYVRLCMPTTIEAAINTTTTLVQRDVPVAATQSLVVSTTTSAMAAQTARSLRESIPSGPRGTLKLPESRPDGAPMVPGAKPGVESGISPSSFISIQSSLCVNPTGRFDNDTREAIRQAKIGARQSPRPLFNNTANEIKSDFELQAFADAIDCKDPKNSHAYLTAFEKFRFVDRASMDDLRRRLRLCDRTLSLPDSDSFDPPTRSAIVTIKANAPAAARAKFDDALSGALNDALYGYIVRNCVARSVQPDTGVKP